MSEFKKISPLMDTFAVGGPISEHHGIRCYPAMDENTEKKYLVKVINVPSSELQLDALLLSGAYSDEESALSYFRSVAGEVTDEIEILERLSQLEGFVRYDSWQLSEAEDGRGYEICLLGEYKRTLTRQLKKAPMTHLGAINLGLDMCAALTVCRRSGYLYVDLKPDNIFVTGENAYRIGDLGFIALNSLKYTSLPDKYRSAYTAPEITDAYSTLNTTLDVYAVGLILYQIYNDGILPFTSDSESGEPFAPPANADYEMAEIILKACAADPADRWEDPMQLGQALVSYMQRNGADEVPIAPVQVAAEEEAPVAEDTAEEDTDVTQEQPPVEDETVQEETQAQPEEPITEESESEEDFENLSFLVDAEDDETDPVNETEEVSYDEVTDETSEILTQADEIANHPVPDPVVQPEPIDVPMPEPIVEEEPSEEESEATDEEETPEESEQQPAPKKKKKSHWLRNTLIVLLSLAVIAAGVYYYSNYYLIPIHSISLDGSEDVLTVQVDSAVDESLLMVVCADPHGNQITAPLSGGVAVFENLVADTAYTVKVQAAGFHKLTGDTSKAYSTPVQSNIVQFSAVTGSEDGSAILSFTVDGPDSEQWSVFYSAPGEDEKSVTFPSHTTTLNGLTVGKEYTFRIQPQEDLYVVGTDTVNFVASKLVYAEKLHVNSCLDGKITVSWAAPEGVTVESWSARCYNESGYNETVITSQTTAEFTNLDSTDAYTIEVTAAGMSVNQRTYVAKNSVTLSNFALDLSATSAALSWESSQEIADEGWLVSYVANGTLLKDGIICDENALTIRGLVPNASYEVIIQKADGTDVPGGVYYFDTPEAEDFTSNYSDRSLTKDNFTFSMCKTPEWPYWDRYDIEDSDYTTTFAPNEKASFLLHVDKSYGYSDDVIETLFVITNAEGKLISANTTSEVWDDMWYLYYCALDIPALPSEAGNYTVNIYLNGQLAGIQSFTISGENG